MIEPKTIEDVIAECERYFNHHLDYNYDWDTLQMIHVLARELKYIKNATGPQWSG